MSHDKDALLREALETLQSIGTPQHYDYRRIAALIDRITAALEDGVTDKNNGNNEHYCAGMAEYQDPLPKEGSE